MSELTKPGVWTAAAVRQEFIEFFEKKFGHTIIPSSPVIAPPEDTTLLFNNAGMNQFKDIFLGLVGNNHKFHGLKRAVDTQKCIRAGGKHNDLDDVGKDGYHHTFFEMLGNWSFGDYFKVEAIVMAWQLLTVVFKLDPNRLYVTYFMGDKKAGLEPDLDAKELWKKVGVADDHIIEGNMKDNFWEMGEVGPCGPCSEIHYDRIGGRNAAALVNQDDPNVLEIWNIVFMTYNREANGQLPKLPNQHIDTGMGFERLVSILQDKQSNYDTDVFWPLFNKIEEVVGCRKYTDKYGADDTDGLDTAYRICADHLRTASFSIADGCIPDKDDAGYVLRRVIRRGARFANKSFGAKLGVNKETGERDVFFSKLLPALVAQMGDQFPELREKENHIKDVLDEEELAFATTLVKGEVRFKKLAAEAEKNGSGKISGADAFKLYDTFGYPPDLTKIMAEEIGLTIDDDEVKAAEAKHIEASKSNKKATQDWQKPGPVEIGQLKADHSQTESDAKFSSDDITAKVQTIYDDKAKQFLSTTKGLPRDKTIGIVLDKTNFYAEQGGQVADAGKLYTESGIDFTVSDVQIYGGYVIHIGILTDGELSTGDEVICHYDQERRNPIMNNHTGTHVLNHSLRKHLGNDIVQKGSLVDTDKLRFDFSHPSQISIAKIKEIEDSSNEYLTKNLKVFAKDVPLELAKGIFGVRAVFGEQYPDPVRVVSVGVDVDTLLKDPTKEEWFNYSIEFCGGTHVVETGIIRQMIIVEESGIAKGVRRLTVYTGTKAATTQRVATEFGNQIKALEALEFGPAKDQELKRMQNALNGLTISTIVKNEFQDKIAVISKSILAAQKAKQKKDTAAAIAYLTEIVEKPENKDSQYFVARLPIGDDSKIVGDVLNNFKKSQKEKSVYVFASGAGATGVAHGVYIGTGHGSKLTAVEAADKVSSSVGGKSGSKDPTIRTGRGNDLSKVDEAVASITKLFEEKLKL